MVISHARLASQAAFVGTFFPTTRLRETFWYVAPHGCRVDGSMTIFIVVCLTVVIVVGAHPICVEDESELNVLNDLE